MIDPVFWPFMTGLLLGMAWASTIAYFWFKDYEMKLKKKRRKSK